MVENKKKRTLTISTSFDKKKLGESNFRRGKKSLYSRKKKGFKKFSKKYKFLNQGNQKIVLNKKKFCKKVCRTTGY